MTDSFSPDPTAARRQFLSGKKLLQWWHDWGRPALAAPQSPTTLPSRQDGLRPGLYHHLSKNGMACQWDVLLNHGQYPSGLEVALLALEAIEDWESRLSIFRMDSEVSRLNLLAPHRAVEVSDDLWQILRLSQELWELTDGAFDITSTPLSDCWGFLKREGRMPNDREVEQALSRVGMDKLVLDTENQSVTFATADLQINLGGIGKGWTLDRIAASLWEKGIADFLFHAGQSSVLASGNRLEELPPNTDAPIGWDVGVSHPLFPDQPLGHIDLQQQSLGTSGSARQFIHYRGQRLSHILDPRTGRPAQGVLSATVLAPTAALADALGTACFVLGVDGCQRLVESIPELAILLVLPTGRQVECVQLGAWQQQWHPVDRRR